MEKTRKIILEDDNNNRIFNEIIEKDKNIWKKFNDPTEVLKWLNNFTDKREIYFALILANNIVYYTLDQIRALWDFILLKKVKLYLLEMFFPTDTPLDIDMWFREYLRKKCFFIGYGVAGKSGPMMVYYFDQSHGIKQLKYLELKEFLSLENIENIETVFFLDDFIGSGTQAKRRWKRRYKVGKKKKISLNDVSMNNPHLHFIYIALIGCINGKNIIEKGTKMSVILGEELDDKNKCFSMASIVFTNKIIREEAKKIMRNKGKKLYRKHPLGYDNGQLLIAFLYNTPNNTLPVIWRRMPDESWYPLFERYE